MFAWKEFFCYDDDDAFGEAWTTDQGDDMEMV
jgi:hypothetical protein